MKSLVWALFLACCFMGFVENWAQVPSKTYPKLRAYLQSDEAKKVHINDAKIAEAERLYGQDDWILNHLTGFMNYYELKEEKFPLEAFVLYYDMLRKQQNLSLVFSPQDINIDWLVEKIKSEEIRKKKEQEKQTKQEIEMLIKQSKPDFGLELPTYAQEQLLKEAMLHTDTPHEIIALSTRESGIVGATSQTSRGAHWVAIPKDPDFNCRLVTVYHELGHVAHGDAAGNMPLEEYEARFKRLNEDAERISAYVELGKKSFDDSTPIGKKINYFFNPYVHVWKALPDFDSIPGVLWLRPFWSAQAYQDTLLKRKTEASADLFAIEKLFEQHKINTLLWWIQTWGLSGQDTAAETQTHPSSLERALYTAGFLVSKGIDINAALRNFNAQGICIDAEEAFNEPFARPTSPVPWPTTKNK